MYVFLFIDICFLRLFGLLYIWFIFFLDLINLNYKYIILIFNNIYVFIFNYYVNYKRIKL